MKSLFTKIQTEESMLKITLRFKKFTKFTGKYSIMLRIKGIAFI